MVPLTGCQNSEGVFFVAVIYFAQTTALTGSGARCCCPAGLRVVCGGSFCSHLRQNTHRTTLTPAECFAYRTDFAQTLQAGEREWELTAIQKRNTHEHRPASAVNE